MIIDKPKTAAMICTKHPIKTPSAEMMPALIPCDTLLEATYIISFPGVRLRSNEATKNKESLCMLNIRKTLNCYNNFVSKITNHFIAHIKCNIIFLQMVMIFLKNYIQLIILLNIFIRLIKKFFVFDWILHPKNFSQFLSHFLFTCG